MFFRAALRWKLVVASSAVILGSGLLAQAMGSYYAEVYKLEASGSKYQVENKYGYLGAYQMGIEAMIEARFVDPNVSAATRRTNDWSKVRWLPNSYGVTSKQTFLANKSAQDNAVQNYTNAQWKQAQNPGLARFVGQTVQGIKITKEGILGMMHLKGGAGAKAFLIDGEDPTDKFGTPVSSYARRLGPTKLDALSVGNGTDDLLRCNAVFTAISIFRANADESAQQVPVSIPRTVSSRNFGLMADYFRKTPRGAGVSNRTHADVVVAAFSTATADYMEANFNTRNVPRVVSDYNLCISRKVLPGINESGRYVNVRASLLDFMGIYD